MSAALVAIFAVLAGAYVFWRFLWFARDPSRRPPVEEGILSPADGTVVYVRKVAAGEPVIVIKEGLAASVSDILREHVDSPKWLIGIFMSPFDVHYNRAPLDARVDTIRRHPGRGPNVHMGAMHWRTLLRREPYHQNSAHIVQNERTVTRFSAQYRNAPLPYYVVQIGARTVNGIESYFGEGEMVARGEKFGMIRIGSQVDLVLPGRPDLRVCVKPGDRVRAGETIIAR